MGTSLHKVSASTHCFTRSPPTLQGVTFLFDRSQRSKHLVYLVPETEFKKKGEKRGEKESNNPERVLSSESLKCDGARNEQA